MKAKEIITAFKDLPISNNGIVDPGKKETVIRWHAPKEDWIKLNVDGASKGNLGVAGGGGVFRDHYGNWIKAFACYLGWCTSIRVEILSLLKGLRTAKELRFTKVEVHMDSQITLRKIQTPCQRNQPLYFIIKECQELIYNDEWEVKLQYCYREANKIADFLANLGVQQDTPIIIFDSPPAAALPLLLEDVFGVYWLRRIHTE